MVNKLLNLSGNLILKRENFLNTLLKYKDDSLRIVYYHQVSDENFEYYFENKAISPIEFEKQILFLKKKYEIISLKKAIELAENKKPLKNKLVITFDDGFFTNYTIVKPILTKHNVDATFFLIGSCIDNKNLMWRNKLLVLNKFLNQQTVDNAIKKYNLSKKHLKRGLLDWSFFSFPMDKKEEIVNYLWQETMDISIENYLLENQPYLTSIQIKEMSSVGFEFGSHSLTHPIFSKLTYEELDIEVSQSIEIIEKITHKKVISFSYPFGKRANQEFEERFFLKSRLLKTFLGTRNRLINYPKNISNWERDNLEFSYNIAVSRFSLLSIVRNLLKI